MDQVSVETRLAIIPEVAGTIEWQGNSLIFTPGRPWPPGEEVSVRLAAGARAKSFLPLLGARGWAFTVAKPRLVYLSLAEGHADLHVRFVESENDQRLTTTAQGVLAYTVGPKAVSLIYAAAGDQGASEIRALGLVDLEDTRVYACPAGYRCLAPSVSPDGKLLAFEQHQLNSGAAGEWMVGLGHVYVLPLHGSGEARLVGPADHFAVQPFWSPDGTLALYDQTRKAFVLYNVGGGIQDRMLQIIPNELGSGTAWSPDGAFLVAPEMLFRSAQAAVGEAPAIFYSHLYRTQVSTGAIVDLSAGATGLVEDASPAFSPDGRWIAFGRKPLDEGQWTPGRQLWLMRSDGSESRQLLEDPEYNHFAFAWSPDSARIAFVRADPMDRTQPTEIWSIEVSSGARRKIVEGGSLPHWLP